ncbi:MAG: hypothetical protein ACRD82_04060 [Blastocatellia bacterium]
MKNEIIILDDEDYDPDDKLEPEYDVDALRKAAQEAGFDTRARLMRIASDVVAIFPDEEAVNRALREIIAAQAQPVHANTQQPNS